MKIIYSFSLLIGALFLAGCAERFNVKVQKEDGTPLVGVVVSNVGTQNREEIRTDKDGLAVLYGIYSRGGVHRINVDYNYKSYMGIVLENDKDDSIIFIPDLDTWKIIDKSGREIKSSKSQSVMPIYGDDNK